MKMQRLLVYVIAFVIVASSSYGSVCEDRLYECPNYSRYCNNALVRMRCHKTCGVCKPDGCAIDNGGCDHICRWNDTKAVCSCFGGYRLNNNSCIDINECEEGPNPCRSGLHCVNTIGSFACAENTCSATSGMLNYYRSGKCCRVAGGTCGTTRTMEEALAAANRSRIPQVRVLGGRRSVYSAWPWQVQITYQGYQHCGATLIAHQWLVGAAHCFNKPIAQMNVYLGHIRGAQVSYIDNARKVERAITKVIKHPRYSRNTNDIALIQLSSPVTYGDAIKPLCLPCGEVPHPGTKCWVTGFGKTEEQSASDFLREVDVPIVEHKTCANAFLGFETIDQNAMMCAGYSEGKKDSCKGDSGGPLMCQRSNSCQWYLAGVTSFGKGCATRGYYGVYSNVVNYEAWIRETIGRNSTGMCQGRNSPCQGLVNHDSDCYTKLDRCATYPHYMQTNCKLACCQLRSNEVSDCYDEPGSEFLCKTMKHLCTLQSGIGEALRQKCRRSCGEC